MDPGGSKYIYFKLEKEKNIHSINQDSKKTIILRPNQQLYLKKWPFPFLQIQHMDVMEPPLVFGATIHVDAAKFGVIGRSVSHSVLRFLGLSKHFRTVPLSCHCGTLLEFYFLLHLIYHQLLHFNNINRISK